MSGNNIPSPPFSGVRGHYPHGIVVLPFHQIADDGFLVGGLFVRLAVGAAELPEIVQDQVHRDIETGDD
jgi:hypothetical protein